MSTGVAQVIQMPDRNTMRCPACGRNDIKFNSGRFVVHSVTPGKFGDTCYMSRERTPVSGLTDRDHERRVDLVTHLAWRLKDEDPQDVWKYLAVLDAAELQRLLMLALAAIPVDRTVDELFAWVYDLPDALAVEAAGQ